ncbi:hypothetical protein GMRT_15079 [Giardia muris]|uniref:Uncharacterized protein n=1 Tax=Giardia muris TaxID=5742 RepID=A0A4Z1SMM9_GIAMU|nr:hypothetical protein GMRT_15079 [Giardia muris]|eukprot:TNJ26952.1 hypothetical protein GMRT_15079 [Giardia muris]
MNQSRYFVGGPSTAPTVPLAATGTQLNVSGMSFPTAGRQTAVSGAQGAPGGGYAVSQGFPGTTETLTVGPQPTAGAPPGGPGAPGGGYGVAQTGPLQPLSMTGESTNYRVVGENVREVHSALPARVIREEPVEFIREVLRERPREYIQRTVYQEPVTYIRETTYDEPVIVMEQYVEREPYAYYKRTIEDIPGSNGTPQYQQTSYQPMGTQGGAPMMAQTNGAPGYGTYPRQQMGMM